MKGSDCANCIRTCPYNKDYTKLWPKVMRALLNTRLRKLALIIDDRMRLHDQVKPSSWWRSNGKRFVRLAKAKDHAPDAELAAQQARLKKIRDTRTDQ